MKNYIVTVETNFNREVVCTTGKIMDTDGKERGIEITSRQRAKGFVKDYQSYFPHCHYHIYQIEEVNE